MTETAPHHYGPVVERLDVSAYRIPTALPGGDATLTWNSTTLVLVKAAAAGEPQAKPGPVRRRRRHPARTGGSGRRT